jgi:chaperone modulatory protein CbpM
MTAMTGLTEAARMLETVSVEELRVWIGAGWILPDAGAQTPSLSEADLARARLIHDLTHDLALDAETVPMVLSLVDQIHGLRRELKRLASAVSLQPDEVLRAIAEACRGDRF